MFLLIILKTLVRIDVLKVTSSKPHSSTSYSTIKTTPNFEKISKLEQPTKSIQICIRW